MTLTSEAKAVSLKGLLQESERLLKDTGHYHGINGLDLKEEDPLRYESFHTRLRSVVVDARETSKKISASPGVREVGESVVALYTPEGDSIVLSTGIMIHVHTMSRFIKWMINHDYEVDPGFKHGDLYANNDPFVSDVHPPDLMTVTPIFWEGELVGWTGAVCHEIEIGGVVGGANMGTTAERFGNGLTVTAEKIGENDTVRRDYFIRAEYNLRTPIFWILDQKAMVSACIDVREKVFELIREYGIDYYKQAMRELIEEGRLGHHERMKLMTVPGRYRVPAFSCHIIKGKPGVSPICDDLLIQIPLEVAITPAGGMKISVEGTSPQSWSPYNMSETAFDGLFFVCLTQFMDYDGRVNDGAYLGLQIETPRGSWANPTSPLVSIGGGWALIMATFPAWQRAMSRAFLARGYKEEVFVGGVTTPIVEGGGINQYGQVFGAQNLECAAEGGGARAIMDGIDCAYVIWNPEADMGNVEVWEQFLPVLHLGRNMVKDHYGWGKYRGGTTFSSLFMVHRSPLFAYMVTLTSDLMFDQAGMCGGYPAPTAHYHFTVEDSDLKERAKARLPLPHVEGDPHEPDIAKLSGGKFREDRTWLYQSLKDGDVFQMYYHTSGGYGDPIERNPALVKDDLDREILSVEMAERICKVVARYNEAADEYEVDLEATKSLRQRTREERKAQAVPASKWFGRTRERLARKEVAPLVAKMYRDSMGLSEQWRREFVEFWQLDQDFSF